MRATHSDDHADLAQPEPADPVDDRQVDDRPESTEPRPPARPSTCSAISGISLIVQRDGPDFAGHLANRAQGTSRPRPPGWIGLGRRSPRGRSRLVGDLDHEQATTTDRRDRRQLGAGRHRLVVVGVLGVDRQAGSSARAGSMPGHATDRGGFQVGNRRSDSASSTSIDDRPAQSLGRGEEEDGCSHVRIFLERPLCGPSIDVALRSRSIDGPHGGPYKSGLMADRIVEQAVEGHQRLIDVAAEVNIERPTILARRATGNRRATGP